MKTVKCVLLAAATIAVLAAPVARSGRLVHKTTIQDITSPGPLADITSPGPLVADITSPGPLADITSPGPLTSVSVNA